MQWNKTLLSEHTIIRDKAGLQLRVYAYELYMLKTNTLPPQEYFDKSYTYEFGGQLLYEYWYQHKDDVDKVREYINEESFTNLLYFLVLTESKNH